MDEQEYAQALMQVGQVAMHFTDNDGKAALDMLCDAMAFVASENGLDVSGIVERFEESKATFDDVNQMGSTGQTRSI